LDTAARFSPRFFLLYTAADPADKKVWTEFVEAIFMTKIRAKFANVLANSALWGYVVVLVDVMSWRVALALVLMVCVGLTEGVGLLLLVPLLQLVGLDVQQGTVDQLAGFVLSVFTVVGVRPTLIPVLVLYVLVISTQTLLLRWQTTTSFALQFEFVAHLRRRLYRAIANTDWLFFSRNRASDFAHALTSELERVGAGTDHLLSLVATSIVTSVYLALAVGLSPVLTILAFACGAGLLLVLKGKTRLARVIGRRLSTATGGLYATTIEHLAGMKTSKSYGAQDRNVDIFSKSTERIAQRYIDATRNQAEARSWFGIGSVLILSLIVLVSVEVLALPIGGLLLLLFLFVRIMPRFSSIQQSYQNFANMLPAFVNVMDVQARCEAAVELEPVPSEKVTLRDDIRFERVSFAYEEKDEPLAISELDLTIRVGETTAIVGPSGAGKSTIADLVIGLLVPTQGRVLVDGRPLNAERMRGWRDQIGYVAQDTFLLHDTIRANLLWACPNASDEEIHEALRAAAAEDFVSRLPEGIETVLGDRGVRLSGGERQRLALARALLRKPSLLILDEATSSLDPENEKRIQHAIEELHGSMTILIITHRLFTVQSADVIYVLEQGRLIESGDRDTLIAREDGRFLALCKAQSIDTGTPLESTGTPLES
jgi:ATP-binding cassette subfamily C protein